MHPYPPVSIIIAAASAERTLPPALDAIEAQDYRGPIEVVVAAADEGSARAAAGHEVVVVSNPTGSTPAGLNLAAGASTGEILVRVDTHSLVPSDYVTRVVGTLLTTNADNVGGRQVPTGRRFMERAIAAAMSSRFGAGDARYRVGGAAGPTDTVYLGAFRRVVFDQIGGYDENFVRNQDYELNHRLRAAGGIVWFDPEIRVDYRPRGSLAALASQYFQYGRWKRFFARSHDWSLRPRQWAPPILVITLAPALLGSVWWPWLLTIPAAYLAALILIGLASIPRVGLPGLLMPVALAIMHVAWGAGFLIGQSRDR